VVRLLTVREVAECLAVCTATVYALVERGEIRHLRVSNAIRIYPDFSAWKELEGPLLHEVAMPLVLLLNANWPTPPLFPGIRSLEQTFPTRIAGLASKLLERIDLHADGPLFDPIGIQLLGILGRMGDTGCRAQIIPLVDDSVLGTAAVAAIWQIDARPNAREEPSNDHSRPNRSRA
jgi:excisionase family DNA binding protein